MKNTSHFERAHVSVARCPILSAGLCAHPAVTNCVPGGHVAMLRMCCGSAWAAGWRAQDASPPRRLPYHFHHHHHHHHLPFSSPPSIGTRLPLLPSTNIASQCLHAVIRVVVRAVRVFVCPRVFMYWMMTHWVWVWIACISVHCSSALWVKGY